MKTVFASILFSISLIGVSQPILLDSAETKYFAELGFEIDSTSNYKLFDFVCQWTETPYKYAGKSLSGVDCSSFAKALHWEVYNIRLLGNSTALPSECMPVEQNELKQGDLIFFNIYGAKISHVGVYLGDNKFVHASTKLGVTINDLSEKYYAKRYFSAGRVVILVDK
ncbi:MAG: C40 family peptidase [Flavobacteriales bacterium]|nr:C40 family peptidase [Flavobacteriales bacterium]